ncbi:MAG TPA: SH3 domain-containing protein [Thermodesulfobacteriota bacterium]|nr:SH3 domain-containing protein [Thermodesulfobacteriota bacterium]
MKNKDEIEELMNKELSRLSHDFELDLIRLIKTLSLISQSKSILEKHTEYLRARSAEFQKSLSSFTITLLELEKEIDESTQILSEVGKDPNYKLNKKIERLRVILGDYLAYAREMSDNLKKTSEEQINSLELAHRLYTQELCSNQIELDSRLKELQSNLSKTFAEFGALTNEKKITPLKSEEGEPKGISPADKPPITPPEGQPKNITGGNKGITIGLASLIFVALLFGLWLFYNQKEPQEIGEELRPEAVLPKEPSEEVVVEFSEEKERTGEETISQEEMKEIPETNPAETEEVEEKIEQPPSQKKLLTVIGAGAYVRGGPGIDYPVFSVVKEGEIFERLDAERGNWIKIQTWDGTVGWISKKVVREVR